MIIINATKEEIEKAAELTGDIKLENFKALNKKSTRFNVKVSPITGNRKWGKINAMTGRKINAVNWLGFYKFFQELYNLNPNTVVKSTFGTFTKIEEFKETQYKNVGSQYCAFTPLDQVEEE